MWLLILGLKVSTLPCRCNHIIRRITLLGAFVFRHRINTHWLVLTMNILRLLLSLLSFSLSTPGTDSKIIPVSVTPPTEDNESQLLRLVEAMSLKLDMLAGFDQMVEDMSKMKEQITRLETTVHVQTAAIRYW